MKEDIKMVEIGMNNIYLTLNQLDLKANPNNVKYMFGVYQELERCIEILKQVGDTDEWK